jgi:hypothetical protein
VRVWSTLHPRVARLLAVHLPLKQSQCSCRHIEALFAEFAGEATEASSPAASKAASKAAPATFNELPLLHQGDTVHRTRVFHSSAESSSVQVQAPAVEEAMLQLLLLPGVRRRLMPEAAAARSEDEAGRQRTAMAAHCSEHITVAQLQRFDLLERMVGLLPANAQV